MAIKTTVAVLALGHHGHGNQVGTGSLLAPAGVLVHPPLSHRLFNGEDLGQLHVCVASWHDMQGCSIEVIPVADLDVADMASQELAEMPAPLVALALEWASSAVPNPPLTTLEELAGFLQDPFNAPATDDSDRISNIVCAFVPKLCRK